MGRETIGETSVVEGEGNDGPGEIGLETSCVAERAMGMGGSFRAAIVAAMDDTVITAMAAAIGTMRLRRVVGRGRVDVAVSPDHEVLRRASDSRLFSLPKGARTIASR